MDCGKKCFSGCGCVSIIVSVILAAIVGVLFYFGYIPDIITLIWLALGLGSVELILLFVALIAASFCPCGLLARCLCMYGNCLLIGSLGTIVAALAGLALVFTVRLIFATIIVALGALFTALAVIAFITFLLCLICTMCGRRG